MAMKENSPNSSAERSSLSSQGSSSELGMMSSWELAKIYTEAMNSSLCEGRTSDQYALELFHRATRQGDQEAWEAVHDCFREPVRIWLHQHAKYNTASCLNSEEHYVAHAFARFWQSTTAQQLDFGHLSEALQYLGICLNAVILDALRMNSQSQEGLLRDPIDPERPRVKGDSDSEEVWELLTTLHSNEREQRLAYLLFHCGLKPKDIVLMYPLEFNDVREISNLRCSIFKRLLYQVDGPIRPIPSG
jgi:hypothetical protein